MSLAPQKSHAWDGSPGLYEFGWGGEGGAARPVAGMEQGAKHTAATFSPALIAMVAVLSSAFFIVSYYKFFYKYCKNCPRRRGFESQELEDGGMIFQDSEAWQIFHHAYGLDEAVIRSIPLYIFRKEDENKFLDGVLDCSVCLLEFKEKETLRVLPKCSHAFHVSCIDVWLRSHANCPLCRANVVINQNQNNNDSISPFVPAMAGRIRPNLEHGIAGVVHDSFRSEEDDNIANSIMPRSTEEVTRLTSTAVVDLEAAAEQIIDSFEDLGAEYNFAENLDSEPVLKRSYSFGCSGNERYSSRHAETSLDSLLVAETGASASASSPWKRAFKRFNSPFNSKGGGFFSLRSPFFNRARGRSASSSSAVTNFSSMLMSPARDYHHRRCARDFRGGGSLTRIRGGSLSPPFSRVQQPSGRAQSMTSPLFVKRSSFSIFTPSRLRSGDPEALLSPHRFKNQPE